MWFLPSCDANILVTGFEPAVTITKYIVVVPPFAEEMNKSRKACSEFARQVAKPSDSGTAVYLIDLFGCGDSEGELCDASWHTWSCNINDLVAQLSAENPEAKCTLLGLRIGALLALDCAIKDVNNNQPHVIFWQPALNASQYLNQFFRMKIAASMVTGEKLTMTQLRSTLCQEKYVEVSGYTLSLAMVESLESLRLHELCRLPNWLNVLWIEVGSKSKGKLLPLSEKIIMRWQQHNAVVSKFCIDNAFWQSAEITTAPVLVRQTVDGLSGAIYE